MTIAADGNDNASYDPAFNVCRGTDPRCYHDWAEEERVGNQVLIYTRTAGPRHANLGPARSPPASIRRSPPATSCRTR